MLNALKFGTPIRLKRLVAVPSTPENGILWYNSTTHQYAAYVDGGWDYLALGSEVDDIESSLGTMVDTDGTWVGFSGTNYLDASTSTTDALERADTATSDVATEVDAIETSLGTMVDTDGTWVGFSGTTYLDTSTSTTDSIEKLDIALDGLTTEVESVETSLGTMIAADGTWTGFSGTVNLDTSTSTTNALETLDSVFSTEINNIEGSLGSMIDVDGGWLGFTGTNYINAALTTTDALEKLDAALGAGTTSLQSAYTAGNTITTADADGDITIAGTRTLVLNNTGLDDGAGGDGMAVAILGGNLDMGTNIITSSTVDQGIYVQGNGDGNVHIGIATNQASVNENKLYLHSIETLNQSASIYLSAENTTAANGGALSIANGTGTVKINRYDGATNFIEEEYIDGMALSIGGPTTLTELTVPHATWKSMTINYTIIDGVGERRAGRMFVVTNNAVSTVSITDHFAQTNLIGVSWNAIINGGNIEIQYTAPTVCTMHANVIRMRS